MNNIKRPFKFRVWDNEKKSWCSNSLLSVIYETGELGHLHDKCLSHHTIQQFTGLKEKGGNSLYEGDIVKYCHYKCIVEWDTYRWVIVSIEDVGFRRKGIWGLDRMTFNCCKKIGNIFENPELIK